MSLRDFKSKWGGGESGKLPTPSVRSSAPQSAPVEVREEEPAPETPLAQALARHLQSLQRGQSSSGG